MSFNGLRVDWETISRDTLGVLSDSSDATVWKTTIQKQIERLQRLTPDINKHLNIQKSTFVRLPAEIIEDIALYSLHDWDGVKPGHFNQLCSSIRKVINNFGPLWSTIRLWQWSPEWPDLRDRYPNELSCRSPHHLELFLQRAIPYPVHLILETGIWSSMAPLVYQYAPHVRKITVRNALKETGWTYESYTTASLTTGPSFDFSGLEEFEICGFDSFRKDQVLEWCRSIDNSQTKDITLVLPRSLPAEYLSALMEYKMIDRVSNLVVNRAAVRWWAEATVTSLARPKPFDRLVNLTLYGFYGLLRSEFPLLKSLRIFCSDRQEIDISIIPLQLERLHIEGITLAEPNKSHNRYRFQELTCLTISRCDISITLQGRLEMPDLEEFIVSSNPCPGSTTRYFGIGGILDEFMPSVKRFWSDHDGIEDISFFPNLVALRLTSIWSLQRHVNSLQSDPALLSRLKELVVEIVDRDDTLPLEELKEHCRSIDIPLLVCSDRSDRRLKHTFWGVPSI